MALRRKPAARWREGNRAVIRKLDLDKEILADPDEEVDWNKAPGDEAANRGGRCPLSFIF